MSDEEVDELLKAVDTSSGELNYMGKDGRLPLCDDDERLTWRSHRHGQDDSGQLSMRRWTQTWVHDDEKRREEYMLAGWREGSLL